MSSSSVLYPSEVQDILFCLLGIVLFISVTDGHISRLVVNVTWTNLASLTNFPLSEPLVDLLQVCLQLAAVQRI